MTVIPLKNTTLAARGDADFDQPFVRWTDSAKTVPLLLAGWSFRFVVKEDVFAAGALLEATTANGGVVVLDEAGGRLAARFDKTLLAAAIPAAVERLEAVYALQASGPGGADQVWAGGPFVLLRGL